jgi:hypothetical protein
MRILRAAIIVPLFLLPLVGCGPMEELEPHDADLGLSTQALEASSLDLLEGETVTGGSTTFEAAALSGSSRIVITDCNKNKLKGGDGWKDNFYRWHVAGTTEDGEDLCAPSGQKKEVGTNKTQLSYPAGAYAGECVSMVKSLSHRSATTGTWSRGANVMNDLPVGTAIATFPGGGYSGHTAFFAGYIRNSNKQIVAIRVWDQNWNGQYIRRHRIDRNGTASGVGNANNYYAVVAPNN